jgi:hypothetical protein
MTAQIERVTPIVADEDGAKRRQIIEGARRVFLAQSFDAASMGEIARAAGVSKGGVAFGCVSILSNSPAESQARPTIKCTGRAG